MPGRISWRTPAIEHDSGASLMTPRCSVASAFIASWRAIRTTPAVGIRLSIYSRLSAGSARIRSTGRSAGFEVATRTCLSRSPSGRQKSHGATGYCTGKHPDCLSPRHRTRYDSGDFVKQGGHSFSPFELLVLLGPARVPLLPQSQHFLLLFPLRR